MPQIIVTNRNQETIAVDAEVGLSVMENIRDTDQSVDALCGGMCACATCHVYVADPWVEQLPPRSFVEDVMLQDLASFDALRSRLSCQIRMEPAYDGLELAVAPEE
jgi:2Fe-2S ferredoxin